MTWATFLEVPTGAVEAQECWACGQEVASWQIRQYGTSERFRNVLEWRHERHSTLGCGQPCLGSQGLMEFVMRIYHDDKPEPMKRASSIGCLGVMAGECVPCQSLVFFMRRAQ